MADAATGLPLSVTLTGVWDGVDLASPPIKHNLNICQVMIDDAVGLFKNFTNATLIGNLYLRLSWPKLLNTF